MKKLIQNIIVLLLLIFTAISCDDLKFGDAFLEKPISNEMNLDSVFSKKVYAEQQLAQVYHSLPDLFPHDKRLSWGILESITDLADYLKPGGTAYHQGNLTAADAHNSVYSVTYNEDHGEFSATYGIRQAYIFLENVDRVPDMTESEKTRRKGEAKLIIAYHYMQMFRNLGGMPWVDHAYSPTEDMNMTRMTLQETLDKVVPLIDEAASMLPWGVTAIEDGRMTAAGAIALKSRLLQFAASPLYNNDKPYKDGEAATAKIVWFGNYSKDRWQHALDAGHEFMRKNKANNNLYKLVDTGKPREDFYKGYFERYNHEVLISSHRFVRWDINAKSHSQIKYKVALPTLNYADMFQMKDGSEFDWNNPEHRAHPFFTEDFEEVRDPRLYETLIVTGDKFGGRRAEIYKGGREQPNKWGPVPDWRWNDLGHNGISVRKFFQDHFRDLMGKFFQAPLIRLPEIYFNIAEAMNELGVATQKDEFGYNAYDYVNLVRNRVGMPGITPEKIPPGEALREAILRERALEFGYEEVRYYDITRWKHKDYLDVPLRRLESFPEGEKDADGNYRKFTYKIVEGMVNERVWVKKWDNKYYLCPIPLHEINKKYGLIQNPGWD